jgi:hypothetical protein
MRNRTKKILTLLLALAVACLPLQAFACTMGQGEHQGEQMDHSAMHESQVNHSAVHMSQMDHPDGTGSNCCDPEDAASSGDCAGFEHCGSCTAGTSINSPLAQLAVICLQTTAVDSDSGEIAPSHSSPPYHPPTLS